MVVFEGILGLPLSLKCQIYWNYMNAAHALIGIAHIDIVRKRIKIMGGYSSHRSLDFLERIR